MEKENLYLIIGLLIGITLMCFFNFLGRNGRTTFNEESCEQQCDSLFSYDYEADKRLECIKLRCTN